MKKLLLILSLLVCSLLSYAQPANDVCSGAINLGTLPTPNPCDGSGSEGDGAVVSFNGLSNVNATPDNPYTYIADCQGGTTDMASPAQDVWYTITATGNSVTINLHNLSGFSNPSMGFWEGNCAGLTARGCANGTGNVTFEPTTPGQTYYIQISGDGTSSEGTFDLDISNSNDCSQCVLGSNLTVDPLPVNGTYTAGTEVNFCYTISEFEQVNTNWVHGVVVGNLGAGWDLTFGTNGIGNIVTPNSCANNYGDWIWYDSPAGCLGNSNPGWYYTLPTSANPCQNFGDPDVAEPGGMGGCALTFCFTLRTDPLGSCNPASPQSLGFSINTSADGETGSWTSLACENDPEYDFSAIQACCEAPVAVINSQIVCFGDSNGIATVTAGSTSNPFNYQWYTSGGTIGFETTGSASTTNTESSLFQDTYTIVVTDNNGCQAATDLTMTTTPGASVIADVDDIICGNESKTIANFVASPGGATFTWTATNDVGFGTAGSTQIGTFIAVNNSGSPISSEVTVIPESGGCAGIPEIFTLTVNPSPQVTTNYQVDCSSAEITSSFTPIPTPYDVDFSNGLTTISENAGGAMGIGSGTSSLSITGITPTTLQSNQISSACFSLRHGCYGDMDYFTVSVNGTTYTSTSGSPAGATFNAELATMLANINGATNDIIYNDCFSNTFLSLFDGEPTNSTWDLTFNDPVSNSCGTGSAVGEMVEWEIIIENTPEYNFSWSPSGSLTGTTSGATTVGTLPTVTAISDGTYLLEVTDDVGCMGIDSAVLNCALALNNFNFFVKNEDEANFLNWTIHDLKEINSFSVERQLGDDNKWIEMGSIEADNYINEYLFLDKTYAPGVNYYRIKVKYNDNTIDYSEIKWIENMMKNKKIKAVYNVFGQNINLNSDGFKYIIYDDGSCDKVWNY